MAFWEYKNQQQQQSPSCNIRTSGIEDLKAFICVPYPYHDVYNVQLRAIGLSLSLSLYIYKCSSSSSSSIILWQGWWKIREWACEWVVVRHSAYENQREGVDSISSVWVHPSPQREALVIQGLREWISFSLCAWFVFVCVFVLRSFVFVCVCMYFVLRSFGFPISQGGIERFSVGLLEKG